MTKPNPRGLAWVPAVRSEGPHDPTASAGLFVGVRSFTSDDNLAELVFAVDDAIDLAHLFSLELGLLSPDRVLLALAGEPEKSESRRRLQEIETAGGRRTQASQSAILRELPELGRRAGPAGMFFFSFASHGFISQGTDYLVAADSLRRRLERTGIPMQELFEDIDRIGAQRRLILIDACRERLVGARSLQIPELPDASGQMVLYGTSTGGFSFEDPELRNGVFTSAVLAGLRGEAAPDRHGFITANALADFVEGRVTGWLREKHPELARMGRGIERRMSGPAGHIRLAASAFHQRRDAALDQLRRNLGGPLNGALFDRIVARLETAGPSEVSLGLIQEIEALDGGDRTRRNLVVYFEHDVCRLGDVVQPFHKVLDLLGGVGGQVKSEEGRARMTDLASEGNSLARVFLANAAKAGDYGLGGDLESARVPTEENLSEVRRMASRGSALAATVLGYALEVGAVCEPDPDLAMASYRDAAKQNEPVAMYHLGYLHGPHGAVETDLAEAIHWYRRAAELGHALAACGLGSIVVTGQGVVEDRGAVRRHLEQAAQAGAPAAHRLLGLMYRDGQGGGKDAQAALRAFRKGAERDDTESMRQLSILYSGQDEVERDEEQMLYWARRGVEQSHAPSMSWLGAIHADAGEYDQALDLWRRAAEGGHASAMNSLGYLYSEGLGVEKDDAQAVSWFQRAVDRGNVHAMFSLGTMYRDGRGVEPSFLKAGEFLWKARISGHPDAAVALAALSEAGPSAVNRPIWKKPSFWKSVGKTLIGS